MKKIVLGLSFVAVLASCQKVKEGSNKSVLRLDNTSTEGFPYSADAQGVREKQLAPARTAAAAGVTGVAADSVRTATVEEVKIGADSTKTMAPAK